MNFAVYAKNLKKFVDASGRTHRSISKELGIGETAFSRVIRGIRPPTYKQFVRLSEILGVKMEAFFEEK